MKRIKERAVRLRRFSRGRGFGVQSPNDYNFITKVVKGHIGSDCCAGIDKECTDIRGDKFRFAHLCYRVARYLKPSKCLCLTSPDDCLERFVEAAVPGVEVSETHEASDKGKYLVILSPADNCLRNIDAILETATDNMWLIIDGINSSDEMKECWKRLVADSRTRITFDMYHYGTICFDRKRYKQNYKIYL